MSFFDRLFGKKPKQQVIEVDNIQEIFHNYEPRTFTNKEYVKEIFDMLYSLPVYKSDKYEVSFTERNQFGIYSYNITFDALIDKIKIKISYFKGQSGMSRYTIDSVKFKDELIFFDHRWICDGPIKQGVYDILNDFSKELNESKEKQYIIENEIHEKYKLEQKKRCERINKEFLELKRGSK
jgi:hypothetical protein